MKKTRWYKDAVFYQIYPRSFKDSNGDGIGDLRGIISKLDYLKDLGIDAVWLSPCFKSPNDDNGYDISDYRDIMDEFGTLDNWKEMIAEMHKRDIRLVMDLVANHSSDEHPWFVESRKSKDNPYRDYYIWKDGKTSKSGKRLPPNNWTSRFLGSAWQYDETTDQYYLHLFSKKQPDLNWANPKVRQEVADICNYWFELGVDGFRCDVITYIAKPQDYRDSEIKMPVKGDDLFVVGDNWQQYIRDVAEKSWDKYDSMIVGECAGISTAKAPSIQSEKLGLLDTVISFDHTSSDCIFEIYPTKFKLRKFKSSITRWQMLPEDCWPSNYLENHDQPRSLPRFGNDGEHRERSAKMLANTLMFLRGTPYIYQGQEIGMTNTKFKPEDFKDIMTLNIIKTVKKYAPFLKNFAYKKLLKRARDHARTPVQWSAEENAGFSTSTPWMTVNPNYTDINAEAAMADENSVWNYYKNLLKIRKNYTDILREGKYKEYHAKDKKIFCFEIRDNDRGVFVVSNFSDKDVAFKVPEELKSIKNSEVIVCNTEYVKEKLSDVYVEPYESAVYLIEY